MQTKADNLIDRKLISIHNINRHDLLRKFFWRLYNHPANNIFMYWATRSEEEFYELFENIIVKGSKEVFVYLENGEPVGTCRIVQGEGPYQHVMGCASTTIDPEKKRTGAGTRLKQTVKEYVTKYYPEIKRHELSYEADNPAARHINNKFNYYEKCGYLTEGQFQDWWPRGTPNYDKIGPNSPYQDWLEKNKGDHRNDEHFWPTSEIFAGSFQDQGTNYAPSQITKPVLRFFSPATQNNSTHIFSLAKQNDIPQLIALYQNSYTEWNDAYIKSDKLKGILNEAIEQKQLFIVTTSENRIVASCLTVKYPCIDHTIAIEKAVACDKDVDAVKTLFSGIGNYYLNNNTGIKRIELNNVVAKDQALITGLEECGYEYCGAQRGRFYHQKENFYLDELLFECKLFRLEDALECCKKRLHSEQKLLNLKGKTPFNIPLSQKFLENLIGLLGHLKSPSKHLEISFEQENFIYRVVRAVCSQDYLSAAERRDYIRKLKNNFPNLSSDEMIKELLQKCDDYLSFKLENQIIAFPGNSKFIGNTKKSSVDIKSEDEISNQNFAVKDIYEF